LRDVERLPALIPVVPRLGHHPAIGTAKFVAREVAATVRVGLAAPDLLLDWNGTAHRSPNTCEDAVVLVHGLLATAGAFSPVIRHLHEVLELDVRTFTFWPGCTLDRIADKIDAAVKAHDGACRIHLVGHSLGGLAIRWYVQTRQHDPRVVQTISIASPFRGVDLANAFPDVLRRLMFPLGSQLDRIVHEAPRHLARVPHLSIVAEKDQLLPMRSGVLPGAPSYVLPDTGHNGALFHRKLFDAITSQIRRYAPSDEL
jgi:pimeloyl-ACP methyl ester carboxylesterase